MRTRSKVKETFVNRTAFLDYYNVWTQTWTSYPDGNGAQLAKKRVETMTDDDTPSGTPYPERECRHTVTDWECASGNVVQRDPWYGIHVHGTPCDFWGLPQSPTFYSGPAATEYPEVLYELLTSLDPAQAVLEGLPFLGELEATIGMIKRPHSFLSRIHVPKGMRMTPVGRVLEKIGLGKGSNAWLQYNYGWAPLFGDISTVVGAASSFSHQYEEYRNGSGGWRKKSLGKTFNVADGNVGPASDRLTWSSSELYKVSLEYKILPAAATGYVLSYPNFLAKKMGLSLDHLASAAWELVPYSFVADWFLPVGDLLRQTRGLPSNIEFRKVSHHHTHRLKAEQNAQPIQGSVAGSSSTGPTTWWRGEKIVYRRNTLDLLETAAVTNGLTSKRCISALSLIAQQLMRPIR